MTNFMFAALAILELLTFNAQKIKGHVTLTTPPFRQFFSGVVSGRYLRSRMPNLKFALLAILELLAGAGKNGLGKNGPGKRVR